MSLLGHASSAIRSSALSLLISSSTPTTPYPRDVLYCFKSFIPYFHVEVSSKPRNEFVALMKKLCVRLQSATMFLLRGQLESMKLDLTDFSATIACEKGQNKKPVPLPEVLEQHLDFRRWYLNFLVQELRPTACYQAHITALKILLILIKDEIATRGTPSKVRLEYSKALGETLPRELLLRLLFDLIQDPFDDVRQTTASLLEKIISLEHVPLSPPKGDGVDIQAFDPQPKEHGLLNGKTIHNVICKAEKLSHRTCRADHADGVGRLYDILFVSSVKLSEPNVWYNSNTKLVEHMLSSLETEVQRASNNLTSAVSGATLHGLLIGLKCEALSQRKCLGSFCFQICHRSYELP